MLATVFTIAATALYGPMAAALTELFPAKVRYTALSFPYHLGTGFPDRRLRSPWPRSRSWWPAGDIYAGLWYPVIFTAISVVACLSVPAGDTRTIARALIPAQQGLVQVFSVLPVNLNPKQR